MFDLMNAKSVFSVDRTDCISYSIKDKSAKVFRKANIKFTNASKNTVTEKPVGLRTVTNADGISYQVIGSGQGASAVAPEFPTSSENPSGDETMNDEGMTMPEGSTGDDYESNERAENDGQAESMGSAALLRNNTNQQELTFKLTGNPLLVAGSNIQFTGIGKLTGKYHLMSSEHDISRESGYTVTGNAKRVGFIEIKKAARKKPVKQKTVTITMIK